jgi:hypothetical protein
MTEGAGLTAYDSSGFGNHGAFTNGPTWTGGPTGSSVHMVSASSQYIAVPDAPSLSPLSDFTCVGTITPSSTLTGADVGFASKWDGSHGWFVELGYGGGDACRFYTSAHGSFSPTLKTMVSGTTYFLAFVWDGVNKIIYIDGLQAALTAATGAQTAVTDTFKVGASNGSDGVFHYFPGNISDMLFYNRGLSDVEIQALYILTGP